MGRTAKKHKKPGEKRKYVVNTNVRRSLYLLKYPITQLSQERLPTNGCVLRYFNFLKSPLKMKFSSVKDIAGCSQKWGSKNLVCQDKKSCDKDYNYLASEVIRIYEKAGFTNIIITGAAIKQKFLKLHSKYESLKQLKTLNWGKSDLMNEKEGDFVEESSKLFDIFKTNAENDIIKDRMRDDISKEEDIEFIKD